MVSVLTLVPAAAFVVIGSVFVRLGHRFDRRRTAFGRSARRARAQVVDVVERTANPKLPALATSSQPGVPGGQATSFFLVVRFTGPAGESIETQLLYGARPAPARAGDTVEIEYDPDDPTRAALRSGRGSGAAIGPVLIALGAFLVLFGLLLAGLWVLLKPVLGIPG